MSNRGRDLAVVVVIPVYHEEYVHYSMDSSGGLSVFQAKTNQTYLVSSPAPYFFFYSRKGRFPPVISLLL